MHAARLFYKRKISVQKYPPNHMHNFDENDNNFIFSNQRFHKIKLIPKEYHCCFVEQKILVRSCEEVVQLSVNPLPASAINSLSKGHFHSGTELSS